MYQEIANIKRIIRYQRILLLFVIAPFSTFVFAQDTTQAVNYNYNKDRVKLIAAANVASFAGTVTALQYAWYKDYPRSSFHTFNDIEEWKQMDKIGHVYSAYAAGKASMELWRWTGIDRKKRILIGGLTGAAYQTAVEIMDGYSQQWGWSWADFGANILGSAILVSQELAWDHQRFQLKWSFHRKSYQDNSLNIRSNELFGEGSAERFLKDYNGQTYWLSTSLKPIFPGTAIPAWLQISLGSGTEGVFGGRENKSIKDGVVTFDRPEILRYRQWYLAPDIDLSKIRTNKKGVRMALNILSIIKFPTPSLEFGNGKFSWNWLHF